MKRTDIAELESGLRDLLCLLQEGEAVPRTAMLTPPSAAPGAPGRPTPLLDSIDVLQGLLEERQSSR